LLGEARGRKRPARAFGVPLSFFFVVLFPILPFFLFSLPFLPYSNRASNCTLKQNPKKLTPDVDTPVRPPRKSANTASGVRGLGVEEVVVLPFSEAPSALISGTAPLLQINHCVPPHSRSALSART